MSIKSNHAKSILKETPRGREIEEDFFEASAYILIDIPSVTWSHHVKVLENMMCILCDSG